MSNQMTLFNSGGASQLPANIADAFGDEESNLVVRESVPALTFRGGKWRMKLEGEETMLSRMVDGDKVPVPTVQVVVLGVNTNRSRIFYSGSFVEGENTSPDCWSSNGVVPDDDVTEPCAKTCAACPNSVKGSKITENGKEVTACATLRRLAVVPAANVKLGALLMKIPQTSMWDKNNKEAEAEGYYAWDQYMAFLKARGVTHSAQVVTKIKFDPNTAYPKLLFTAVKFIDEAQLAEIKALVASQTVKDMVAGNIGHTEAPKVEAPKVEEADDDGFAEEAPAKKEAVVEEKPKPKRTRKPKQKPVEDVVEDDDDDDAAAFGSVEPAKKEEPKAKPKPASKVEDTEAALEELAGEWAEFDD